MNLGIYLKNISKSDEFDIAYDILSYSINNKLIDDGCVFYDNIGQINRATNFGLFNSTDIWNFHGNLLVFSLDSARLALNIVNNFNIYYLYGLETKINLLNTIDLLNHGLKVICINKKDKKNFYRTTGTFPIGTSNRTKNIVNYLVGEK